jgi:hypothetical protein
MAKDSINALEKEKGDWWDLEWKSRRGVAAEWILQVTPKETLSSAIPLSLQPF